WKGKKIYHDDDRRRECFRKYNRVEDSFLDHSDFLVDGSRYDFLFSLKRDDYKGWARGLKKAGYATNPKYASMLINTIEENRLYLYDKMLTGRRQGNNKPVIEAGNNNVTDPVIADEMPVAEDIDNFVVTRNERTKGAINRIQYVIVKESDTYKSLVSEFDLLSWELFRYNDLEDGSELTQGMLLYLQPKRIKAEAGNDFHIVKEGETMWNISQLYGVKLKTLYERNRIVSGTEPAVGTELWLRKTKPEGL
ncbi:MAG: LysM peptidoglycan-binding domain-containing protein, partial [Bacteroidales bacterium]|nr:LysM peptidoglycan-binding domain-containing protein [Bacteroidales bacterium]